MIPLLLISLVVGIVLNNVVVLLLTAIYAMVMAGLVWNSRQ